MIQPPGFEVADRFLVCRLNKALYGLKQALRAWFDRLKGSLVQHGFKASKCDPSLFFFHTDSLTIMILVYVDDIIITGNSPSFIASLVKSLNNQFSLKDLGQLDYFLGIEVTHMPNGSLILSQTKYIIYLLAKVNMATANGMPTPMVPSSKLSKFGSATVSDPTQYRSIVGALQMLLKLGLSYPILSTKCANSCQILWRSIGK